MSRPSKTPRLIATLVALAAAQSWGATGQSSAGAQDSSSADETQQVTVLGRLEFQRRVTTFVDRIAALQNEEGLARWDRPVCPLEWGLRHDAGEVVLERIVKIARTAGVPLARGHCRPNLFILDVADPKELLQGWAKRSGTRSLVFGNLGRYVTNEFIDTPRAVRVWHSTSEQSAVGLPLSDSVGCKTGDRMCAPSIAMAESSHLVSNAVWTFSSVFVIADQKRMHGVTLAQFADYVAMVAFAELKPGAQLGDAPTVLKLFDEAPQAAPAGMTDWDRAFLKALYATAQNSKLQRSQIAGAMVHDILH